LEYFDSSCGDSNLLGIILPYLESLHFSNMVFSQFLYETIILVVLEVLIEMHMDNIKCYLWNALVGVMIVKIKNWKKIVI
jgi:hypothetical protein